MTYDEAFEPGGAPRAHYAHVMRFRAAHGPAEVQRRVDGELAPRHLDLRPFAFQVAPGEVRVLPGGLSRYAPGEGDLVINAAQGGGGKDTWVLQD